MFSARLRDVSPRRRRAKTTLPLARRSRTRLAVLGGLRRSLVSAVAAKYILALVAVAFLAAALIRLSAGGAISHPQTKTWLLIAVIFGVISAWLWWRK